MKVKDKKTKKTGQKQLRWELVVRVVGILILSCGILGGIGSYFIYHSSVEVLQLSMMETAKVIGNQISAEMNSYVEKAKQITFLSDMTEKSLAQAAEKGDFLTAEYIDADGVTTRGGNVSESDYFKACMSGSESYISGPSFEEIDGEKVFTAVIAVPVYDTKSGQINGVAAIRPKHNFLSEIIAPIKVAESGGVWMINKEGTIIADLNPDRVGVINEQEIAKTDPSAEKQAAFEKKMTEGEVGYEKLVSYDGIKQIVSYAPVEGETGWSAGVYVMESDFTNNVTRSIIIDLIICAVLLLVGLAMIIKTANSIVIPVKACADRLRALAKGDLTSPVPEVKRRDEIYDLQQSTVHIVNSLKDIIKDEVFILAQMGQGNFTEECQAQYSGDYAPLKQSIVQISQSLTKMLLNVDESAEQVSSGSGQVSSGAQALSQGVAEQASSVEELAATINEISSHITKNAENARLSSEQSDQTVVQLAQGEERMQHMITAMNQINSFSTEIGKVIKTIEDIAFQTNILALNAAVEAARAGSTGKGFAVVAGEVRNLASKSSEASKSTAELITATLDSVENGVTIADEVALSLKSIAESSRKSASLARQISDASQEQAVSVAQVTQGIDQIASVVQTNSATAEESAAASIQLSDQAQGLKELVGRFKLKK